MTTGVGDSAVDVTEYRVLGERDSMPAFAAYIVSLPPTRAKAGRFAATLFNLAGQGRWDVHKHTLAILCGAVGGPPWALPTGAASPDGMLAYIEAFAAGFASKERDLRAGGQARAAVHEAIDQCDPSQIRPWYLAMAQIDQMPFESVLGIAPERKRRGLFSR